MKIKRTLSYHLRASNQTGSFAVVIGKKKYGFHKLSLQNVLNQVSTGSNHPNNHRR